MTNSHEVINLETMAQCLADARTLLRDGDMCADTYVSLLEEAARLIRSVLAFAQDVGLEIKDGEETEAWAICDRCETITKDPVRSYCQDGQWDLYPIVESLGDTLVLEPGSDTAGKPQWLLCSYDLGSAPQAHPESNLGKLVRHFEPAWYDRDDVPAHVKYGSITQETFDAWRSISERIRLLRSKGAA